MNNALKPSVVIVGDSEQALRRLTSWDDVDALASVRVVSGNLVGDSLVAAIVDADVLVLVRDRTPFGEDLLGRLPKLKYVIYTGTRNTTLDLAALQSRGIPVSHTGWGPSKDSTCEMTWALILACTRRLEFQAASLRSGYWRPDQPLPLAPTLHGKTLGLVGLGEIGGRVARVGQAFGMNVVTWSPNMTQQRAQTQGAVSVTLDDLMRQSDVVSLHLVPSTSTQQIINAQRLALMKPGSLLVNTSRAALVDNTALVDALRKGCPGFAGLDVFDQEPLPLDHPLRNIPNAMLTPHIGFVTEPVFTRFATDVVECLLAWLRGEPLVRKLP